MPKRIMIIAGESSGDFHGASLISALKSIDPDIEISGLGGERMRQSGAKILFDISELSIIGFTDVLKNLKKIKQAFNLLLKHIDAQPPQAVILIDYPGFNLKIAKEIKKRAIPVIYYISPQVWAWWKSRIKTIKQYVDKMIVLFKFEEALYREHAIDVSFVGHPLLDIAHPGLAASDFLNRLGLSADKKIIGLMPGSRKMEVERILPILLASAKIIQQKLPGTQVVLLKAPGLAKEIFTTKINKYASGPVVLCENYTYEFLSACDFVLVASGTATLEAAVMQTPMVIVYKVSFLNWLIARALIRLPFIGLVNVVAGERLVPEFIQHRAKPELIARAALEILSNQVTLTNVKAELEKIRKQLGPAGASQRAAEIILELVK